MRVDGASFRERVWAYRCGFVRSALNPYAGVQRVSQAVP